MNFTNHPRSPLKQRRGLNDIEHRVPLFPSDREQCRKCAGFWLIGTWQAWNWAPFSGPGSRKLCGTPHKFRRSTRETRFPFLPLCACVWSQRPCYDFGQELLNLVQFWVILPRWEHRVAVSIVYLQCLLWPSFLSCGGAWSCSVGISPLLEIRATF